MKGTVVMLNDHRKKPTTNAYHVSLLPAWLLNQTHKADSGCTLVDLSDTGAAVLVPRSLATTAESFDLVFMSPDSKDEILTTLQAGQRWRDEEYSDEYIKIGVVFNNIRPITHQIINAMIEILEQKKTAHIQICL